MKIKMSAEAAEALHTFVTEHTTPDDRLALTNTSYSVYPALEAIRMALTEKGYWL